MLVRGNRILIAMTVSLSFACTHGNKQKAPVQAARTVAATAEKSISESPRLAEVQLKVDTDLEKQEFVSAEFQKYLSDPQLKETPRGKACNEFMNFVEGQDPVDEMKKFDTYGIVVANEQGQILLEKYYKGMKPETVFRMFSISKLFTVLSFGSLQLEKGTSETARLSSYLSKDIPQDYRLQIPAAYEFREQLSVDHLLTMSSGVPWCEYTSCAGRDALALTYSKGRKDAVGYYFGNALPGTEVVVPGSQYIYSAGNSVIIQAVLRSELREDYLNSPMTRILEKLDEKNYAFERDEKGVYLGGSGLFLTTRAMAKLGMTLLHRGNYGGKSIVSPEYVERMTGDSLQTLKDSKKVELKAWEGPTGMGVWLNSGTGSGGPGFPSFMPDAPENMIYGSGLQGKRLLIFPEDKNDLTDGIVIARTGVENNHSAFWQPLSDKAYRCFRSDKKPVKTPREIAAEKREKLMEPGNQPPVTPNPKVDAFSMFSLVRDLVPLKIAALELCNCAFVSGLIKKKTNGAIDEKATIKNCINYSKPDFSALGKLAPVLDENHVRIEIPKSENQNGKVTVSYFRTGQKMNPGFVTVAENLDRPVAGAIPTCQITREPSGLSFLKDKHFDQLFDLYSSIPAVDRALLLKAINAPAELTLKQKARVKELSEPIIAWFNKQFEAGKAGTGGR